MRNTLFYGDNLEVLRDSIADASVDLVYLDPPFNSNRDYNVLFKEQSGTGSAAQIKAFGDTWKWANAAADWDNFPALCPSPRVQDVMEGFLRMLGHNDVSAYLVMMAPRLWHLHRVLKPTGSLYLHCDPTASHYLKILLDAIFGPRCFRNEIVWKRTSAHNDARRRFGAVSDTILYYVKSEAAPFYVQHVAYDEAHLENFYRHVDEKGRRFALDNMRSPNPRPNLTYDYKGYKPHQNGWTVSRDKMEKLDAEGRLYFPVNPEGRIRLKRYLDEMSGTPVGNVWEDIGPIQSQAAERLGYPTQKPLALLERIITASSNPGDVVLDCFCGCGTAIVAAQTLGRKWIGIDVTSLATSLIIDRLDKMECRTTQVAKAGDPDYARAFDVTGLPTSMDEALALYDKDPLHKAFEMWAVGLVPMLPQEKKSGDKGIDGIRDYPVGGAKPLRAIAQVKGGKIGAPQIQQLRGAMLDHNAQVGIFISLEPIKQTMYDAAALVPPFVMPYTGVKVPGLQLRTIAEILDGKPFDLPHVGLPSQAVGVAKAAHHQADLGL